MCSISDLNRTKLQYTHNNYRLPHKPSLISAVILTAISLAVVLLEGDPLFPSCPGSCGGVYSTQIDIPRSFSTKELTCSKHTV